MSTNQQNKLNENDLFNNPFVRAARERMTPEQLEQYQKEGRYLWSQMEQVYDPLADYANDVEEQLKSGCHPSYLSKDEMLMMENRYGNEWCKKFGWESTSL